MIGQIVLDNASFEGKSADATMPAGWFAASEGTTPDILPGYWGVYNEPRKGETYIGLITRADGSFESIQQRVYEAFAKGTCYEMSMSLAHSDNYAGYNHKLRLRIWLSDKKSKRQQLIYISEFIESEEWLPIDFEFIPEKDHHYIILEAFISDKKINYEGNILIDDISPIRKCKRA
jgi:hypothetical protein